MEQDLAGSIDGDTVYQQTRLNPLQQNPSLASPSSGPSARTLSIKLASALTAMTSSDPDSPDLFFRFLDGSISSVEEQDSELHSL